MISFASDNVTGASQEIVEAVTAANQGHAMPYGNDEITQRVEKRLQEIFETDCAVFPVATGTAANVLGLSLLTPSYGVVYCYEKSHINGDECGAPEFYTGGAKLVALKGKEGKISPEELSAAIFGKGVAHQAQPAAVSISQASEEGTVYGTAEVAALSEIARANGLGFHVDGARFANALVTLGCTPAEATWKCGVDILSFGATKNGALGAEAVICFRPELAGTFGFRRKRGGHLFSKMRFLSAQLDAYLIDDLWLKNASHANAMAQRLAKGLMQVPGVQLHFAVEANEIFARFSGAMAQRLLAEGFHFYHWGAEASPEIRLVTAFNTRPEDVDAFLAAARKAAA